MQEPTESVREWLAKVLLLLPGIVIGLSAKLSKINRDRKLTFAVGFFEASTAFMAVYVTYHALTITGNEKYILPAACICARYGDEIVRFIWIWTSNTITTILKSIKK